jgi:hypothetical protein
MAYSPALGDSHGVRSFGHRLPVGRLEMKPAPMTDEQIKAFAGLDAPFARAIIAARDAQWEQMLNKREVINDPAEIRRVFEIDDAEMPPPESGFMKI